MAVPVAALLRCAGTGARLIARPDAAARTRDVARADAARRDTADAIRRLAVRGAPHIGIAAAYGLAMEVAAEPADEASPRPAALSCAPRGRRR